MAAAIVGQCGTVLAWSNANGVGFPGFPADIVCLRAVTPLGVNSSTYHFEIQRDRATFTMERNRVDAPAGTSGARSWLPWILGGVAAVVIFRPLKR